jgi:hypothetical protein
MLFAELKPDNIYSFIYDAEPACYVYIVKDIDEKLVISDTVVIRPTEKIEHQAELYANNIIFVNDWEDGLNTYQDTKLAQSEDFREILEILFRMKI